MRAVDTNVLVLLLTRDDVKQVAAAEEFIARGAWVSQVVLVETMWVLSSIYGLGAKEIATAVEMLLHHRDLTVQETETFSVALATFRARPGVGFSDCLVLASARRAGHLPVGTFDRVFGKISGVQRI